MDEIYGYFPPHPASPPTKRPLLTLLKQARALGVSVVLATQNPVDLGSGRGSSGSAASWPRPGRNWRGWRRTSGDPTASTPDRLQPWAVVPSRPT
ncbi:MAG: hypothetical protein DMF80_12870 [Acidobacteria bacterium]|nr:MAG: hypothetical protein DMF80_12870 [Acidobacteriota bacterium]